MKLFDANYYHNKCEDLEKMVEVVAYREGYAGALANVWANAYRIAHKVYDAMLVAEREQDYQLAVEMERSLLENAVGMGILTEEEAEEIEEVEEVLLRLSNRALGAYFEADYYHKKGEVLGEQLKAAARVAVWMYRLRAYKYRAVVALMKIVFPWRFN